jgi:two-component system chemotaxis response regulator CheB
MPQHRDLIVIGASMGGIEAYQRLLAAITTDIRASILVVQHLSPSSPGLFPSILQRASAWPVSAACDGETLQPGHIYAAVPDRHLMVEGNRIRLSRGPRESRARPSVDVLFRSAAYHYGRRVIGVVLTGMLDDGTAGLWAIKDRGGIAIAQAPTDAACESMPASAIRHVDVDYILKLSEIPEQLRRLTREPLEPLESQPMSQDNLQTEVGIALENDALGLGVLGLGEPSHYTCPECHGSMVRIQEGRIERYRCHTGHAFSEQVLAQEGASAVEKTLWAALAQLEEHYLMLKRLAERSSTEPHDADRYRENAARLEKMMRRTRELASDPVLNPARAVEA